MTLYKGKYRVESTRLPNHNYAANGWYFVTICTRDRAWFFGEAIEDLIQLSEIGKIAQQFWAEIPKHFASTYVDAYVIMPNHIHGIVVIDRPRNVETQQIETRNFPSLQLSKQITDKSNKFAPLKPGSLQAIIHAYKSSVTRWCRKNGQDHFSWQERFYEHIIRNDESLDKIRQYIFNNPAKWEDDKNNPANLWM